MRSPRRVLIILAAGFAFAALHLAGTPAPALATSSQIAIIEDDGHMLSDPMGTLERFRGIGAQMVRVFLPWSAIAPDWASTTMPDGFDGSDPAAYPDGAWDRWDAIVRDAKQVGIAIDLVVAGGAPKWADRPGIPSDAADNPNRAWYPSPSLYGDFVRAAATRYGGNFPDPADPTKTLPRVSFWSLWNEPNFGEDLGPQAINGSRTSVAPGMYRGLVNAGWQALQATGHGRDKIVIGELAARGMSGKADKSHPEGLPGNFAQTKPLAFIRTLYCVDSRYRRLKGNAARSVGCPASGSASQFRNQNPGLFKASGFSDHPYPQNQPPTKELSPDPDFAAFSELPNLEAELDKLCKLYGSRTHFPIYNDEYGYITRPPNKGQFVSPATAATYINWAEYLSWRSSRIVSTMQYLLYDPAPTPVLPQGGFTSGLLFASGQPKPGYASYRMPLFLPVTTAKAKAKSKQKPALEVWGGVRPAHNASVDTHRAQYVQIQFQRGSHGSFSTVKRLKLTNAQGYFDTHITFPASGSVRLMWTYPSGDAKLPDGTIYSRTVKITLK
jgi:hypothetical protein